MQDSIKCDVCESENATMKCLDCTKNRFFCDICFSVSHKSDKNMAHRKEIISDKDIEERRKNPDQENLGRCDIHKQNKLKYICKSCHLAICSDCVITGDHKGHDAISIQDIQPEIAKMIEEMILSTLSSISHLKNVKSNAEPKETNMKNAIEASKKAIIQSFSQIEKALEKKKDELLKKIDDYDKGIFISLESIFAELTSAHKSLGDKIKAMENARNQNFSAIDAWHFVDKESKEINSVKKQINKSEEIIEKIVGNKVPLPNLYITPVLDSIKTLNFSEMNMNFNFTSLNSENQGKEIKKEQSKSLTSKKLIKFTENISWHENINDRITISWTSCFKDPITKKYYMYEYFDNVKHISEYNNIDDLMMSNTSRHLSLDVGIDGTYTISYNGFLIHSISNSTKIGRTRLADCKLVENLDLGEICFRNSADVLQTFSSFPPSSALCQFPGA